MYSGSREQTVIVVTFACRGHIPISLPICCGTIMTMKTILVTGASAGFGAATVRCFAQAGWRMIAFARRADARQG